MRVFIDPGHGGKDPGAIGNGLQEKDVVLELALALVIQILFQKFIPTLYFQRYAKKWVFLQG